MKTLLEETLLKIIEQIEKKKFTLKEYFKFIEILKEDLIINGEEETLKKLKKFQEID